MYLRVIYIFPESFCLFGYSEISIPILGIYNLSHIHECENLETEHYNSILEITSPTVSFLGIHKLEPDIYIGFLPALHLQYIGTVCQTKYRVFLCSCSASNLVCVLMDQQNVFSTDSVITLVHFYQPFLKF
jgi:hypothetical protein